MKDESCILLRTAFEARFFFWHKGIRVAFVRCFFSGLVCAGGGGRGRGRGGRVLLALVSGDSYSCG